MCKIKICTYKQALFDKKTCKYIEDENFIKALLSGKNALINYESFDLLPTLNYSIHAVDDEVIKKINLNNERISFDVPENQSLYLKINSSDSYIDINLKSSSSKVIFYQSKIPMKFRPKFNN